MNVENTFDEVVFNAAFGYVPTEEDLVLVTVPPGVETDAFFEQLRMTVAGILEAKREGAQKRARDLAADAASAYLTAFDMQPKPRSIHEKDEDVDFRELIKTIGRL